MAKGHPPRKTPSTSRQGSRKGGGQASSSASNQCILIIFIVLVILWYIASISSIIILDKELEWRIQENVVGSDFYEKGLEDDSLAVISACIPGKRFSQEYIDASLTNKELFCNKWHAECILSREKYDTNATYSPKWEKLYLINRTLYESSADWIMWMDCDAAFTNMDINWKSHLSGYLDRRKDLIASKDKNFINLGVLFVSNTLHAREFIKKMWDKRHWIDAHPNKLELKDQAALKMLILEDEKVRKGVNSDIPQELINSVSEKGVYLYIFSY